MNPESHNPHPASRDHGIYMNLRGEACVCGDPKLPGKSFCRRDYFKLPQPMRSALYQGDGYPVAYRAALFHLGLPEPATAPITLRDVFPNGGAFRRRRSFR